MIKRQFGHVKTRYRGLAKNRAQLFTLFALGNLFLVRRRLMGWGRFCPKTAMPPHQRLRNREIPALCQHRASPSPQTASSAKPRSLRTLHFALAGIAQQSPEAHNPCSHTVNSGI